MAISKNMKRFTHEGKTVVFNPATFQHAVNEKVSEINRKKQQQKGGQKEVFRMIAKMLNKNDDPDVVEGAIPQIKNWYQGNNGPGDLETIFDLAEAMECENRSAFLTEIKDKKENNTMNRTNAEQLQVNLNQNAIIEAMRKTREKEEAYRLYSAFADCMEQYLKADIDVWVEYEEGTPEWKAALAALPKRLPLKCAIQKAKMFVSNDTIMKADNLLDEMFGYGYYAFEEPSDIKSNDINYRFSEFYTTRLELYDQYLTENGIKLEEGEPLRNDDWNVFMYKLNNSWWEKLEEAFEEYIPEREYVFD